MEQVPRYMSIGDFCKYSGLSRWQFRTFADRNRLTYIERGKCKMVDVEAAMALLPRAIEKDLIWDRREEIIERLKASLAADQQVAEPQPQNVT